VIGRAHSSMNAFFVLPSHDKRDFRQAVNDPMSRS
jgi:hypothetical protein